MALCLLSLTAVVPNFLSLPLLKLRVFLMVRSRTSGTNSFSRDSWKVRVRATPAPCYHRSVTSSPAQLRSKNLCSLYAIYPVKRLQCAKAVLQPRFPSLQHDLLSGLDVLTSKICGIPLVTRRTDPDSRGVLKLSIHRFVPTITLRPKFSGEIYKNSNFALFPICSTGVFDFSGEPRLSTVYDFSPATGGHQSFSLSGKLPRSVSKSTWLRVGSTCSGDLNSSPPRVLCFPPPSYVSGKFPGSASSLLLRWMRFGPTVQRFWAWPNTIIEAAHLNIPPKCTILNKNEYMTFVVWVCGDSLEISDGFIGVCIMRLLPYLSFMKSLSVDSPCSSSFSTSQLCPLSRRGDVSSGMLMRYRFSLFIFLLSCVAVCTGPEDAIENTLVFFVDESWLSTSHYVTILQLTDFVVKASSTHSSFISNSLSSSEEDLSYLVLFAIVACAFCCRGWKIPSDPNKFE